MSPNANWSIQKLGRFASQNLASHSKIAGQIKALQKKDATAFFRAGKALHIARQKLKELGGWNRWLKEHGIAVTSAFEAISLYDKAGAEKAVKGLGVTEAKVKHGVVRPKPTLRLANPAPSADMAVLEADDEVAADHDGAPRSTPLGWYGGKQTLSPTYVTMFPPHKTYVEVFGGGAATLFCKPPSKLEVYNDIDSGVVNFFRVLREHPEDLDRLLKLTPYSREEFETCKQTWQRAPNDIEKARRFFVMVTQSYGKLQNGNFGVSYLRPMARYWAAKIDKTLIWAAFRLRPVVIEQLDFRRLIPKYDGPDTLFAMDPPYVHSTRSPSHKNKYAHELQDSEHGELLTLLSKVKGKVMLMGYDNNLYAKALKGWDRWKKQVYCATGKCKERKTEVVWANFPLPAEIKHAAA